MHTRGIAAGAESEMLVFSSRGGVRFPQGTKAIEVGRVASGDGRCHWSGGSGDPRGGLTDGLEDGGRLGRSCAGRVREVALTEPFKGGGDVGRRPKGLCQLKSQLGAEGFPPIRRSSVLGGQLVGRWLD